MLDWFVQGRTFIPRHCVSKHLWRAEEKTRLPIVELIQQPALLAEPRPSAARLGCFLIITPGKALRRRSSKGKPEVREDPHHQKYMMKALHIQDWFSN